MKIQIDEEVRNATADEKAVYERISAELVQAEKDRQNALEARKAPLRRIGLTEDEITVVLGF